MKWILGFSAVACVLFAAAGSQADMIEARVGLGTDLGDFFDAPSGFTQGDTSHTNTQSFTDGVVQVDFDITVEGFDAGGAPAGLRVNPQATGVELGVSNDQVDPGESVKFTINNVTFSTVGPTPSGDPVDPSSFSAFLSSIRLAAFTSGTDTYTYAGLGSASAIGDDTETLSFLPNAGITNGDMFSITGDSGAFRILFLSMNGRYDTIPEPTALAIALIAMAGAASRRRHD